MRKVNLIPMAGEGQRFIDAGFTEPKPLIDLNGLPMVVRAAKSLPEADKWIFICRKKHIKESSIDKILAEHFPDCIVLDVENLTEGQASTCLLAKDHLLSDDQLTIGACDNEMKYDTNKFVKLIEDYDCVIWTFRNNPSVLQNPNMYGWVKLDKSSNATGVSCKKSISSTPMSDHAVVGTFSFSKAAYFLESAERIITKNRRINNEYYLDIVLDECIVNGYKVKPFEVNKYTCWGTPKDLEKYMESRNE